VIDLSGQPMTTSESSGNGGFITKNAMNDAKNWLDNLINEEAKSKSTEKVNNAEPKASSAESKQPKTIIVKKAAQTSPPVEISVQKVCDNTTAKKINNVTNTNSLTTNSNRYIRTDPMYEEHDDINYDRMIGYADYQDFLNYYDRMRYPYQCCDSVGRRDNYCYNWSYYIKDRDRERYYDNRDLDRTIRYDDRYDDHHYPCIHDDRYRNRSLDREMKITYDRDRKRNYNRDDRDRSRSYERDRKRSYDRNNFTKTRNSSSIDNDRNGNNKCYDSGDYNRNRRDNQNKEKKNSDKIMKKDNMAGMITPDDYKKSGVPISKDVYIKHFIENFGKNPKTDAFVKLIESYKDFDPLLFEAAFTKVYNLTRTMFYDKTRIQKNLLSNEFNIHIIYDSKVYLNKFGKYAEDILNIRDA
jgi:hypothetical protein